MEEEGRGRLSGKASCATLRAKREVSSRRSLVVLFQVLTKAHIRALAELYKIFSELDKNGDMHLDVSEIRTALDRAGIEIPDPALADFVASIASSSRHQGPGPAWISFPQFRDYLLLLPRKPSVNEVSWTSKRRI